MKRVVRGVGSVACVSVLLMLSACNEKPVTSLASTEAAIQEARRMGAQDYASEGLKLAEDQYQKAQEEIAMQENSFSVMRDYKASEELLLKARMEAEKAVSDTNLRKVQAKTEAEAAVTLARNTLSEARTLLAQAPKGKGTQADLQALKGDLEAADSINADLDLALGKEDYLGVKAKAEAMRNLSVRVHDQVTTAMQKAGKAKA